MSWTKKVVGVLGVLLAVPACGGGDDKEDQGGGAGTVTEEWRRFCTGTFTKDYQVIDAFDEPQFVARAGEEYLLAEYGTNFGSQARMIYLRRVGAEEFDVAAATATDFPFTTTCPLNTSTPYYAVFEDVTVYADEALTSKICELKAGTALPRTSGSSGHSLAMLDLFGPSIYEVYLNAFGAQCGGATSGYIKVQQVKSFSSNTWLPPILSVLAPP